MSNLVGTLFHDRYEVLEVLGSGGTSVVYKAKDILLNRLVTIKILREQFARDSKFVNRFRNEAQAVARLSHPNIVSIYDVAFAEGVHYLIMEYVEGGSLKEYMDQHGPLPIEESLDIFQQLLNALQHAHENKVIHRDIKPHNILLDVKHNVRVTDFGLAVTTTELGSQHSNDVMGSVYYMSPEQIKGEQATEATDIYSAGLLLYEMLCSKRPFSGDSAEEIARQHIKGAITPPHKVNPNVPTELSSFVMKAVRRDKQLRFADAGQMLAELRAIQNRSRRVRVKPIILPMAPTVGNGPAPEVQEEEPRTVVVKRHMTLPENNHQKFALFRDKKPTSAFYIILFVALLLLVMCGSAFSIIKSILNENSEVEVKKYVGLPLNEAVELIKADGLQHSISQEYSAEYEKDVVMAQNIPEGQKVKQGRFIELTVSQGKQTFPMPKLEGMTISEANVVLSNNRVTLQATETVSDEVPAGRIISQTPQQGEEVAAGSTVEVLVSKGKEIVVPDLRGRTEDDAMVYLVLQGLNLGSTSREQSYEYEEGYVINQSLTPGDSALEGSSIDLVVSSGPGPQSKIARVSYTLPYGEDVIYNLVIEVTDNKGTREEYKNQHRGGEAITHDVTVWGSGTVKVYLDGDVVYNQEVL